MSLELNCANLIEEGKNISIPPKNASKYPIKVDLKALKEYKNRGGEVLVIPAEDGKNQEKQEELEK